MMEKNEVRKQIQELKKSYSLEQKKEKSAEIWHQMENNPYFCRARTVLIYWSMEDEVFTPDFVIRWATEKIILLPCVKGDELEIRYFEGVEKLCPGEAFYILEPMGELFPDWDEIDLIIVPGVAFDGFNNRLGRGKGYYDKILKHTEAYKIGVCFDFQFLPAVPVDQHDVPMDNVIVSKS